MTEQSDSAVGRPEYESELEREDFDMEFASWEEFTAFFMEHGRSFTGERIRVGEFILQQNPHAAGQFQVAHATYKGNRDLDNEVFDDV